MRIVSRLLPDRSARISPPGGVAVCRVADRGKIFRQDEQD